jgi:hypothetical protein
VAGLHRWTERGINKHALRTRIILLVGVSLILTACSSYDSKLGRQITGTWSRQIGTSSGKEPAAFTRTISRDGSFSTSIGRSSALVTYRGTWLIKDGDLTLTVTNAQGLGGHRAGSPVGSIDHIMTIHVDDHQWIYVDYPQEWIYMPGGHTNILTRP